MKFRAINSYSPDEPVIITTKDEPTKKGGDDYEIIACSDEDGMEWVWSRLHGQQTVPTIGGLEVYNRAEHSYEKEPEGGFKPLPKPPDPFANLSKVKKDDESDEPAALMEISKTDEDQRLVFGWAYQTHDKDGNLVIDKSGEYVEDPDELEKAAYNFVIKSRTQGDMHKRSMANEANQVGTMVESMVFTPEKIEKMGLPKGSLPTGWWTGFRVDDDDAWAAVKRGERKSFSIHGKAVRKEH